MKSQLPLIIECRCNDMDYREDNPNFPYSPKEIIQEAVRAWEAGASIFHWHGRDPISGKWLNDTELYLEVIEGIRAKTDLIIDPTLGYITTQNRVQDRVRHILAAIANPALGVDMVPLEFGSLNVDFWDPQTKQFKTFDQVYANSRTHIQDLLNILKENNVYVSCACWDIGQIRTARCFQEMGLLSRNTFWEFVFTGEIMPSGILPTLPNLQAVVDSIPAGDPWLVMCWNGDVMHLAAWAITMGGHVGIGLGDDPYIRFGKPHNGELVEKVAKMAHTLGREVATPAQTREILKMKIKNETKN
jgi:3-keto-5-aminohexanoate cleavage enzyme